MAAHIQTMETQDAMLSRRLGTAIAPRTCEDHLHELSDYATLLDNRYSKAQANRRTANSSNVCSSNNSNSGSNSGRCRDILTPHLVRAVSAGNDENA